MYRLDKACDVTAFCDSESTRYALSGIRFDPEKSTVEATNGHVLISIPMLNGEDGEFPHTPGQGAEPTEAMTIPAKSVKDAIKAAPKRSPKPIITSVLVTQSGDHAVLSVTDLETRNDQEVMQVDGRWPGTECCWPTDEVITTVSLDAKYLALIATHACRHAPKGEKAQIDLELRGPEVAVVFRFKVGSNGSNERDARAVLMTLRE